MTDHPKLNSVNSVLLVVITLVLDLLLIPRFGVIGAAAASAGSTVFINVFCLFEVLVLLGMQPYDKSFLKPLAAGLVCVVVTLLLNQQLALPSLLQLVIGGSVLWGSYFLMLILLKLPEDDLLVIKRLRSRINFQISSSGRVVH
jgi:O-antigen/teichoic acid export membrane protein